MSVIRDLVSAKRDALGGEALPEFKPGFISSLVSRVDAMPEKERITSDFIHVSAMVDWCPRKYVLQARSQIFSYTDKSVTGAHRVVWALGRAAEKHVRESFIKAVDFRGVFGVWGCVCGRTKHSGFYDERKTCGTCKGKLTTYNEFTLFDEENHVSGNPDMLIVRRKRIYPVEIKSLTNSTSANAKGRGFDTLAAPFGDHVFQVDAYHYMLERTLDSAFGLSAGDKVIVLYVNKEFKWGSPYKEFHLRAIEPKRKMHIRKSFGKAREVWEAIHTPKAPLPPRTLCSSPTCDRAKYCPVVQECFARK